ncbi:MAG: hypothetical protein AAB361_00865 [Patescibacteria group bacterium]
MKKLFLIILAAICFLAPGLAKAVSIKVSPPEVKIETTAGFIEKEITIENPGTNVALFEVYLDNFSDFVKINPESFILESGKSKKVVLEVKPKEAGVFSGMISVVAKPLSEKEFKANAGVKIPLEIRILEKKSEIWIASVLRNFNKFVKNQPALVYALSIIIILSFFVFLFFRIKNKKRT